MEKTDYTFSFDSSKTPATVFEKLLDVRTWWSGLFEEQIAGKSQSQNDEFTFNAGGGLHYSKQRLVELEADRRIVWQVIESKLSFLQNPDEWTGTRFGFGISEGSGKTQITFTHYGLKPKIECYNNCSSAWTAYMQNIAAQLK